VMLSAKEALEISTKNKRVALDEELKWIENWIKTRANLGETFFVFSAPLYKENIEVLRKAGYAVFELDLDNTRVEW